MLTLKRTNSDNTDFQQLVLMLNKDLEKRNGVVNDFFVQFNKIDEIKNVIIIIIIISSLDIHPKI